MTIPPKHTRSLPGALVAIGASAVVLIALAIWNAISWNLSPTEQISGSRPKGTAALPVSQPKPGTLAMDAFSALKKIEAATEAGISYIEYRKQLAEAWYHVKTYLESPEATSVPTFADSLRGAMLGYNGAAAVWKARAEGKDDYERSFLHITGCPARRSEECERGMELVRSVPDLVTFTNKEGEQSIPLDDAIQGQFRKAGNHLATAQAMLR